MKIRVLSLAISTTTIVILIVAAIFSALFPITAVAAAHKNKNVSFEQYTFELVPGNSMSLRGVDATVSCSDGTTVFGPLFGFNADKDGPSVSGTWRMIPAPGAAAGDGGSFDKAIVTAKHFKLTGTWLDSRGTGRAITCYDATIPAFVLITGNCGIAETVSFRASNGVSGTFKGDVICSNS